MIAEGETPGRQMEPTQRYKTFPEDPRDPPPAMLRGGGVIPQVGTDQEGTTLDFPFPTLKTETASGLISALRTQTPRSSTVPSIFNVQEH